MSKLKVSVIGLGKQNTEDHIPAVNESEYLVLDSVVDTNKERVDKISTEYGVDGFTNVNDLLKFKRPDIAVVAVPHNQYLDIIRSLAKSKVHIIKEKPFAISMEEAIEIDSLISDAGINMMITLQRRFNPIFSTFEQLKNRIGKIYSLEGRYTMNIPRLDLGWRASKDISGGGALIDMGYHYVDLLLWYFGLPKSVTARMSTGNREGQDYDVEDTVNLLFNYEENPNGFHGEITGNFLVSRAYPKKEERLLVIGRKGTLEVSKGQIKRLDENGEEIEVLTRVGEWPSAGVEQVNYFAKLVLGEINKPQYPIHRNHFGHVAVMEAAYQSHETGSSISPVNILKHNNLYYG